MFAFDRQEGGDSPVFDGRLVIALGERDGIAAPAIAACAQAAGAEVAFSATECFV